MQPADDHAMVPPAGAPRRRACMVLSPTVNFPRRTKIVAMSHGAALPRLACASERRRTMRKWLLRRWISKFERTWNYDANYLRELVDADPQAMLAFGKLQAISRYRRDVSAAAYCAAGLLAAMAEDCGPCTQLGIDMAERGGVKPEVLRAIVDRDFAVMTDEVALAVRFTEATLRRAPKRTICGKRLYAGSASAA
jgi:hypothetical protein